MAGYGNDSDFEEWLFARGITLPAGSPSAAVLRQRGSDYIDALYGPCFYGIPTEGLNQERSWPRTNAIVAGIQIDPDSIPLAVIMASYRAAVMEAESPGSLSVITDPNKRVKRQRVEGAVEREFFEPGDSQGGFPVNSLIHGMLRSYVNGVCMGWIEETGSLGIWAVGR